MRRALVALACGGCYAPTITPGVACDTTCPEDQVCIDRVCREPGWVPDGATPDIAVPGDRDGDGTLDVDDNCPELANVDQHDEDADALGDVCDPCLHLAGPADDADDDGVGDACDPEPSAPRQRIRFFDPFTAELPAWQLSQGFAVSGGQLRSAPGGSYADLDLPIAEARIAAAGTVISVGGAPHQVAIQFGFSGSSYHYGEFYDDASNNAVKITRASGATYTGLAATPYPPPLPIGPWAMQLDVSAAAGKIDLASRLGGVAYPTLSASAPTLVAATGVGVNVENALVVYDYFLVIETTP